MINIVILRSVCELLGSLKNPSKSCLFGNQTLFDEILKIVYKDGLETCQWAKKSSLGWPDWSYLHRNLFILYTVLGLCKLKAGKFQLISLFSINFSINFTYLLDCFAHLQLFWNRQQRKRNICKNCFKSSFIISKVSRTHWVVISVV